MAVLMVLPLVGLLVLVVVLARSVGGPRVAESWQVLAVRTVGLVVGVAGGWWLAAGGRPGLELGLGRGPMLAPVAVGAGLLLGVVLGELLVRPAGSAARRPVVRTADLAPRRVRDHAPRALGIVVLALTATCAALLTFTSLTASADDGGRAGRALTRACVPDTAGGLLTASRGPYPGSFYSVPLAVGLALCVALAWYAARRSVLRPRGTAGTPAGEDVLRRRSVTAVVAALGIAVAAPLAGIAATTASALAGHDCPAPGWGALAVVLAGVVLVSTGTVLWCLLTLVLPTRAAAPPAGPPRAPARPGAGDRAERR